MKERKDVSDFIIDDCRIMESGMFIDMRRIMIESSYVSQSNGSSLFVDFMACSRSIGLASMVVACDDRISTSNHVLSFFADGTWIEKRFRGWYVFWRRRGEVISDSSYILRRH